MFISETEYIWNVPEEIEGNVLFQKCEFIYTKQTKSLKNLLSTVSVL